MVIRRAILAVKIPVAAARRAISCGRCFLVSCGSGRRRRRAQRGSIGGVHRAAVLLATHYIAESKENPAEQHNAEKQSYQVPALKNPVATTSASAA